MTLSGIVLLVVVSGACNIHRDASLTDLDGGSEDTTEKDTYVPPEDSGEPPEDTGVDTEPPMDTAPADTCDPADEQTWYRDADGDGHGNSDDTTMACAKPDGYVESGEDCDDSDREVFEEMTGYEDGDGDGYTTEQEETLCTDGELPDGYQSSPSDESDCNDDRKDINPGAEEACNEKDDDCDGDVDEGDAAATTWYVDCDGDGYAADTTGAKEQCEKPPASANGCLDGGDWTDRRPVGQETTDCYDSNTEAKPGQTEYFGDDRGDGSYDYDCSGELEGNVNGGWPDAEYEDCHYDFRRTRKVCTGSGWKNATPDCGSSATYVLCGTEYDQLEMRNICTEDKEQQKTRLCR